MLKSKVVLPCLTIVKLYSCVYRTSADRTMALTATSVSMHRYLCRISSNCTVIPYTRFFHTCIFHPCVAVLEFSVLVFSTHTHFATLYFTFPYLHFPVLAISAPPSASHWHLCNVISPFHDFCCFWSVTVNTVDKLLFSVIFIFIPICNEKNVGLFCFKYILLCFSFSFCCYLIYLIKKIFGLFLVWMFGTKCFQWVQLQQLVWTTLLCVNHSCSKR